MNNQLLKASLDRLAGVEIDPASNVCINNA